MSILKVDKTIVILLIFHSLVPTNEICIKHFWEKNPKAAIVTYELLLKLIDLVLFCNPDMNPAKNLY